MNKSIAHNQIFTVSEILRKKNCPELGKHAPEKVALEAPLRKVETQQFGATFPNECVGKVKKFQVPILSRFP